MPILRRGSPRINTQFCEFDLHIHRSAIERFGVFAGEAIPANKRVIQYTGERISHKEGLARTVKLLLKGKPERIYMIRLNRRWKLDGAVGGSGAEFINHSCDPNLTVRRIRGKVIFYSFKKIRPGEELTVDYGFRCSNPCHCGSKKCRGIMCHN